MSIIDTFPKKNKANLLVTEVNQEVYNQLSNEELTNGTMYLINDGVLESEKVAACGYTPIGTIISVMGNTPPLFYLACNGQELNIVDYPDLANYFTEQFGSVNYFGGDGIDTFCVPDLRGEFLRGTGTNSHTNQGNGSSVGTHQDNGLPNITADPFKTFWNTQVGLNSLEVNGAFTKSGSKVGRITCEDVNGSTASTFGFDASKSNSIYGNSDYVTPTNTSVLYCIAYRNICIDAKNNYSTDEQLIGYWIDNKPLYQKVVTNITLPNSANRTDYPLSDIGLNNNIDHIFIENSYVVLASGNMIPMPWINSNNNSNICAITSISNEYFQIKTDSDRSNCKLTIIFRYTKTTD